VLAVKYKDGVVIAADNLASYGSLARFTDVKRLKKFNRKAVVGFGGDVSDMQYLACSTRSTWRRTTAATPARAMRSRT
jgi:20S proteasome alpha/beta subunit